MAKPGYMATIVGAGVLVGLGLGWANPGQTDPVGSIVTTFPEERCLPYPSDDTAFDTSGMTAVNLAHADGYVEPGRYDNVVFGTKWGARHCQITSVLPPWSEDDGDSALAATRHFAVKHVSALKRGVLAAEDVSALGIGQPQISLRKTKFIHSAQTSEGSDA